MDIDPRQLIEPPDDAARDRRAALLNTLVAITVALLATFMGVCKVKDDNIVQAMPVSYTHLTLPTIYSV